MPLATGTAELLALLVFGHFLADFGLQTAFVAQCKNRHADAAAGIWPWIMSAHAAIHAGLVLVITGVPMLFAAEFACHWGIDALRCDSRISFHADQLLHLACKLAWFTAIVFSPLPPI